MAHDGSFSDGGFDGFAAAPSPQELMRFDLNDLGNARRLIRHAGGTFDDQGRPDLTGARLLYLRDHGWIAFDGKRWDVAMGPAYARRLAHKVAEGLWGQAAAFAEDRERKKAQKAGTDVPPAPPKDDGGRKRQKPDPAIEDFYEFARSCGNVGKTGGMLTQAESYLMVDLSAFDPDPWAFNVINGTLKWRQGDDGRWRMTFSRGHDPSDRITRLAPVLYDPKASAPQWTKAVEQWLPEEPTRRFVQRIAGYGLTGNTSEQAFFIFQGLGGDGKSTFVGAVRNVAGDYAATADVKTFLDMGQRSGGDASSDIARLAGETRLVCTAEPPRGAKLNEGMIKSFTGGAPIAARRLRQEQFEFKPKGKVILECNTRPVIKGDDEGIWRRIFIVLWEVRITSGRIKDFDLILARAEGSGILNWLMAGVGDWLARGLDPPKRVSEALEDYRKGSSPFGEWLTECVIIDKNERHEASDFYRSYKAWMERQDSDAKPMSQRAFGTALGERQILRDGKNSAGNVMRRGARLKTELELQEDLARANVTGSGAGGLLPEDPDYDPLLDDADEDAPRAGQ